MISSVKSWLKPHLVGVVWENYIALYICLDVIGDELLKMMSQSAILLWLCMCSYSTTTLHCATVPQAMKWVFIHNKQFKHHLLQMVLYGLHTNLLNQVSLFTQSLTWLFQCRGAPVVMTICLFLFQFSCFTFASNGYVALSLFWQRDARVAIYTNLNTTPNYPAVQLLLYQFQNFTQLKRCKVHIGL